MLTVVGGIGYISGALIGGILYGTAFLVMGDFWAKLAGDWNSFDLLFTFAHDFFLFLGPAVAGIGLGRNPTGIAAQIFDGFRVLGKRESRRILAIMVMIMHCQAESMMRSSMTPNGRGMNLGSISVVYGVKMCLFAAGRPPPKVIGR